MICAGGVAAAAMALKVWNPALNMDNGHQRHHDTRAGSGDHQCHTGYSPGRLYFRRRRGHWKTFVTAAAVAIGAGVGIAAMNVFWRGGGLL